MNSSNKKTDLATGLSDKEAASRLKQYGENALPEKKKPVLENLWGIII
ncbi:MAG: hypothetical protein K2X28_00625 [Alphaproteobacteria bacterium]|nr:hypothetical protein [Alphaproteobacteria bacterium]